MKQVNLIITGYVQDVGYRSWLRSTARNLGIVGWVSNREDGNVEAECQGSEETLKKLIHICKKGPQIAEVDEVLAKWKEPSKAYSVFEIRR